MNALPKVLFRFCSVLDASVNLGGILFCRIL